MMNEDSYSSTQCTYTWLVGRLVGLATISFSPITVPSSSLSSVIDIMKLLNTFLPLALATGAAVRAAPVQDQIPMGVSFQQSTPVAPAAKRPPLLAGHPGLWSMAQDAWNTAWYFVTPRLVQSKLMI